ncbi:MAG: AbrB/MazE/SpoVT family DNA-binding domain-containing protein [Acidilobus sp.]
MEFAPRKLQRLGLSSLVVTLPHKWVKAHNLKAGDLVYVVEEGDRLRIVPAKGEERRSGYVFEAYRLGIPELASMALTCLYVNNFNEVNIDLKGMGQDAVQRLKQTAVRLLGLEIVESEKERATMRVVLDDSRADPKLAIKGLGSAVANLAELVRRVSSGESVTDADVEVAVAELHRYQHLILRHVVGSVSEGVADPRIQGTIVGTAVLAVVGATLLEAFRLARSWGLRSQKVTQLATHLRDLIPVVGAMVAQPSVRRLHEASLTALSLSMWVDELLSQSQDPKEAAVLSKIDDAIKTAIITFTAVLCSAILGEEFLHPEA